MKHLSEEIAWWMCSTPAQSASLPEKRPDVMTLELEHMHLLLDKTQLAFPGKTKGNHV